jgi:hypothetical protein
MDLQHPLLLLLIPPVFAALWRWREKSGLPFLVSRGVLLSLLLLALSGPFLWEVGLEEKKEVPIEVLRDASTSMELFETELPAPLEEAAVPFSPGNRSAIGDAILSSVASGKSLLLLTDGQNNDGTDLADAASIAARLNTSLYAVALLPPSPDLSLEIEGPKKGIIETPYSFVVRVRHTGGESRAVLTVTADGRPVTEQALTMGEGEAVREIPLNLTPDSPGPLRIVGELRPQSLDHFSINNRYHHGVTILSKPRVLLVTSHPTSPLQTTLDELYRLETSSSLTGNLEEYDAVFLDDLEIAEFSPPALSSLREYLLGGGGIVVVGGPHSYDRGGYQETQLEALLPLEVGMTLEKSQKVAVLLALDISGSTSAAFGATSKVDVEKAIAINIIRDLGPDDLLGVVLFNHNAYILAEMASYPNRAPIEDQISRLTFGGGTAVHAALIAAERVFTGVEGERVLILISDGRTQFPEASFLWARELAEKGVTIHTVGVGGDTDSSYLTLLADIGSGIYFQPEEYQRLKLTLGQEEEPSPPKGEERLLFPLVVRNPNHFITRGLELNATVSGFNEGVAKTSAQVLVSTRGGSPVVTVWRFGLGRVVAWTTDDGLLWSPQMYSGGSARLLSTATNWAIGDPERRKGERIDVQDARLGEAVRLSLTAQSPTGLFVEGDPLPFSSLEEDRYLASFLPDRTGFFEIRAGEARGLAAVNYPREYQHLGLNPDLQRIVRSTGGEVYSPGPDLLGEIQRREREKSRREVQRLRDLAPLILLIALLLFLLEVIIRRIQEIRRIPEGGG